VFFYLHKKTMPKLSFKTFCSSINECSTAFKFHTADFFESLLITRIAVSHFDPLNSSLFLSTSGVFK